MASAVINPPVATKSESAQFRQNMEQVTRHSLAFLLGTLFTTVAGYFFKLYLARALGAQALGIYTLGMTIVGSLGVVAAFGLPQTIARFVAMYRAQRDDVRLAKLLQHSFLFLIVSNSLLGFLAWSARHWIAQRFYHTAALEEYIVLFSLLMLLGSLNCFLGQALGACGDVAHRTVIVNFVGGPLMMLAAVALISSGFGLGGYVFAQVASSLAVLILLGRTVFSFVPLPFYKRKVSPSVVPAQVISFSGFMFLIQGLEYVLSQADKIFLGLYMDPSDIGVYSVAVTMVAFVPIVLQSVNQIFSPLITNLHTRGEHALLRRIYQSLTKWIIGLTLPLITVVVAFAAPVMRLFGPEFEPGWLVLVIGVIGQTVNCAVGSVGYLLLMSGNQRRLLRIDAVMAASTLLLDAWLIPRLGLIGAAIAGVAVTSATNLWSLWEVRRRLLLWPYNRGYSQLLLPTVCMTALVLAMRVCLQGWISDALLFALALPLAYVSFVGTALLLGLEEDDLLIAETVWARLGFSFRRKAATP